MHKGDEKEYGIKRYYPVKEVGTPVPRNVLVNQLEVITDTLRARKEAGLSGDILGYVRTGIYDVHAITEKDNYKWYQIDEFWCANDAGETWCHYMPTEYVGTPVERNDKVNQIEVTATTLRAREKPSLKGNVIGFANRGYYNCTGKEEADGYTWFHAETDVDSFWVAQSKDGDWVTFLPAKVPHWDLTMKNLNEDQKNEQVMWCEANAVDFTLTDV